VQLHKKTFVKI